MRTIALQHGCREKGTRPDHVASPRARYSVIDIRFVEHYNETILRVRNPWGSDEWEGKYSDHDMAKDEVMKKVLHQAFSEVSVADGGRTEYDPYSMDASDGTFLISFHDWSQFYTHLFACLVFPASWHTARVSGAWLGVSAGGAIQPNGDASSWKNNPRFELVIREAAVAKAKPVNAHGESAATRPTYDDDDSANPSVNGDTKYAIRRRFVGDIQLTCVCPGGGWVPECATSSWSCVRTTLGLRRGLHTTRSSSGSVCTCWTNQALSHSLSPGPAPEYRSRT